MSLPKHVINKIYTGHVPAEELRPPVKPKPQQTLTNPNPAQPKKPTTYKEFLLQEELTKLEESINPKKKPDTSFFT